MTAFASQSPTTSATRGRLAVDALQGTIGIVERDRDSRGNETYLVRFDEPARTWWAYQTPPLTWWFDGELTSVAGQHSAGARPPRDPGANHASKQPGTGRHLEVRETVGSLPSRYEVEVLAPDGQSFDGERHSLIARSGDARHKRARG